MTDEVKKYIQAHLDDSGQSLRQLALAAGVSYSTLGDFMRGAQDMKLITLDRLVKYCGKPLVVRG